MSIAQLDVPIDRTQPQSPDAERAVLGAILENPKCIYRLTNVTEHFFFKDSNRLIWRAMAFLLEDGIEIDLLTVKEQLRKHGYLEQAGGSAYVSSLVDVVPDVANVERYALILERAAKGREILVAANKAMRSILDNDEPEEVISTLFSSIGDQATPQKKQASPLWEVAAETSAKMLALKERDASLSLPTTWMTFDSLKVFVPTFSVMGAHSKRGKSCLGITLSDDIAQSGNPAVIFSLESRRHEIALRHMSMTTRIPHARVRDWRNLDDSELRRMAEYSREIGNRQLFIEDSLRTAEDIILELRRLKATKGVLFAVVDYIQNVELRRRVDNREERLHEVSKMFLDAANDLGIHILAMSQLRDEAGRDGKRLTIGDLAYAKSIAKSARVVMFLNRPIKDDANCDRGYTHMDVQVEANNEGPTGDFVAQFDEIRQRVWEGKCEKPCGHPDCSRQQTEIAKQERLY